MFHLLNHDMITASTRLKALSNLNYVKVNKQFEKNEYYKCDIDLCKKINIDKANSKSKIFL